MRRWSTASLLIAVVVSGILAETPGRAAVPIPANDAFYAAPQPLPDVPAGTILRSRPTTIAGLGVPLPLRAWQIMYMSADPHAVPAPAIATIIKPLVKPTTTPAPLVSYQVAEDADSMLCAPSYEMRIGNEKEEPSLLPLLLQGWTVVVPDYEGLESLYGAGVQAGHSVLDGIRAAERFAPAGLAGAHTPVGLWGYSGGGLATAWAAELAPAYAPELNFAGFAEGGVASDIGVVARNINGGVGSGIYLGAAIGVARAYPELIDLETLLNPDGKKMEQNISNECIEQYVPQYAFKKIERYTVNHVDPLTLRSVQQAIAIDRLGQHKPAGPIYLYHAMLDELIPVRLADALVRRYCAEGVTVDYVKDYASEHNAYAITGAPGAVFYLAQRFAGVKAPTTCGLPISPNLP